ncbi:IS30 family transposase [Candidatus Berkelbacteria bacterium]|nr:IS30 family transposase [Candidatus Berkelbacteria bacterium]
MATHTKLTGRDRELIAAWITEGLSNKAMARRLGRDPTTIGRERSRNQAGYGWYEPLHAERRAKERAHRTYTAKHPLKDEKRYAYVLEKLRCGWSPEQIAGRLKRKHPYDPTWWICHETIYQFYYHPDWYHLGWWQYLRRGQTKRRKRKGRKVHRIRIPDRVSIHERPTVINQRTEFGHWEGDSVEGKGHRSGIHVTYERVTSLICIEPLTAITAAATLAAQLRVYQGLPKAARRSVTLDNGREQVRHTGLRVLGMATYFTDPYRAWQKGGVENANLWIRYYFPKGTDFATIAPMDLRAVEEELNGRPRKRLQFQTPQEVFTEYLRGCDRK